MTLTFSPLPTGQAGPDYWQTECVVLDFHTAVHVPRRLPRFKRKVDVFTVEWLRLGHADVLFVMWQVKQVLN